MFCCGTYPSVPSFTSCIVAVNPEWMQDFQQHRWGKQNYIKGKRDPWEHNNVIFHSPLSLLMPNDLSYAGIFFMPLLPKKWQENNFFTVMKKENVWNLEALFSFISIHEKSQLKFFFLFLEDINPFCGTTDSNVLEFWWHRLWVSKPEWTALFTLGGSISVTRSLRFMSGATPAHLLAASMPGEPFSSARKLIGLTSKWFFISLTVLFTQK